jgi:hypothetical protein
VVIEISIFRDVTINVTSSTKGSILIMKKNQLCILEKLNEQRKSKWKDIVQPQSLKPTEEIKHRSPTRLSLFQKPGKYGSDPAHYRPISLHSLKYKLLERLILQRIQPLIEAATSVHQAGFSKHRSCTKQVMAHTTHIEAGLQRQEARLE